MELVTSKENPTVKQYSKLAGQKKSRDELGLFAIEGLRLCLDAHKSGVTLESLLCTECALEKHPELRALMEAVGGATITAMISDSIAAQIADTKTPQGVFAVAEKAQGADKLRFAENGRYVLLAGVQDPGNVGAILRSCEAFGADAVLLDTQCADVYSPKTLRAAMGAVFRQRIIAVPNAEACVREMRQHGVKTFATALDDSSLRLPEADFSGSCAAVIGNEGAGLSDAVISTCDHSVYIPMAGGAQSLNAAVAAGIIIWEMCKE